MEVPDLVYWAPLGNLKQVAKALAADPDVNVGDEDGYTALHGAAENGRLEVARFLLERGADPNVRDRLGNAPVDYASEAAMVSLLRAHGAQLAAPGTSLRSDGASE